MESDLVVLFGDGGCALRRDHALAEAVLHYKVGLVREPFLLGFSTPGFRQLRSGVLVVACYGAASTERGGWR
jgi:hypothetical protein